MKIKGKRGTVKKKLKSTSSSAVFPDMQFESCFPMAQSKVLVLGVSGSPLMVPQVDPQDPPLGSVLGQRVNLLQTQPVLLCGGGISRAQGKGLTFRLTEAFFSFYATTRRTPLFETLFFRKSLEGFVRFP